MKERSRGEKFRPTVTVLNLKKGEVTTVQIAGVRYKKETSEDKEEYIKWRESIAKRDLLIKLLNQMGINPKKAREMKIQELEKLVLGK